MDFNITAFVNTGLNLVTYSKFNFPNGIEQILPTSRLNLHYQFHDAFNTINKAVEQFVINRIGLAVEIRIQELVHWFRFFSMKDLIRLAGIHGVGYRSQTKQQLTDLLRKHNCTVLCGPKHIVLFKALSQPRTTPMTVATTGVPNTPRHILGSDRPVPQSGTCDSEEVQSRATEAISIDGQDCTHLTASTEGEKASIIRQWEDEMGTSVLKLVVCAACGSRLYKSDTCWKDSSRIDLSLLTNSDLGDHLLPLEYDCLGVYQKAILNYKGLESLDQRGRIRLCYPCLSALERGTMPRHALANHLYYGRSRLPPEAKSAFEESTLLDRLLIGRARCNRICVQFKPKVLEPDINGHSVDPIIARARRGIKGNIVVVPLDTIRMNNVIPPSSSSIKDTLCAMVIGEITPSTKALLEKKLKPILVRKSRVKTMIQFLLENNPCYSPKAGGFEFNEANLNQLFSDGQDESIPSSVEIGYIKPNASIAASTADYTPRDDDYFSADGEEESELMMENVGYTDGDTSPAAYDAMKALALERSLMGKPFVASRAGNRMISDFENPNVLTWLFPHLDPWGIGGFFHVGRRIKLTLEEQLKLLLRSDDKVFERDPQFAFVFYNVVRKMQVSRSIRFSVSPNVHRRLTADMMSIDPGILLELGKKFAANALYKPTDDMEKKAQKILSAVNMVARNVPGSNGHKVLMRNEIKALIMHQGTPSLFITLNPSDVDNPIVRLLAGEDISLEDIPCMETMSWWSRRLFAAQNPAACAMFFDVMMRKFLKIVLRYSPTHPEKGLFGICNAYYGTVEAQGKGTLHCHMLIWLKGHLPPQKLRDAMAQSDNYRDCVFRWVESVIKCEFPVNDSAGEKGDLISAQPKKRILHGVLGSLHPGTLPAPRIPTAMSDRNEYWKTFQIYLTRLLHEYYWHSHTFTCFKNLKKGEAFNDQNCRLRMNGITREFTCIEEETGALLLRRHHPMIAAYNDIVAVLFKSNTEIKFIGSGRAARDLVFYITDYVTKPSLPVHVGMGALQYAIQKVGDKLAANTEGYTAKVNTSAIITAVNSMMGRQEISHPQVMSFLVGGGDHYTSHEFCTLNWTQVLAYVDSIQSDDQRTELQETGPRGHNLSLDVRKDSVTVSCAHLDYVFRDAKQTHIADLCLYDFVSTVCKEAIPRLTREKLNVDMIPGTFNSWDHPQRSTHHLKLRSRAHVPVLLGPTIPNKEQSTALKELWAKHVLILFKPWRSMDDLLGGCGSWLEAYEQYEPRLNDAHRKTIENLNAFTESVDARASLMTRVREQPNDSAANPIEFDLDDRGDINGDFEGQEQFGIGAADDLGNAVDDVFVFAASNFPQGTSLDNLISETIGPNVVAKLDVCHDTCTTDASTSAFHRIQEVTVEDIPIITKHQEFMHAQKGRRRFDNDADDCQGVRPMTLMWNRLREPMAAVMTLGHHNTVVLSSEKILQVVATSIKLRVIDEMNLQSNPEQLKAFNIVADHIINGSMQQLLMYVSGVGGTGKSHVIKAIVSLFDKLGCRQTLLLGAPTGIAAVLIGGQTLHSLVGLNGTGRPGKIEAYKDVWKNAHYLIIDEVSMMSAVLLSNFSNRVREAKNLYNDDVSAPFGGVNVIFMGDFGQLKPPVDHSLYANAVIKSETFSIGSSVEGVSATNGILLWRQVSIMIELVKNQRHAGDPQYAEFLLAIRRGECMAPRFGGDFDPWRYLQARVLENLSGGELRSFNNAPVIVGLKVVRDAINSKLIRCHSTAINEPVDLYYAKDTVSRTIVPIGLRNTLWNLNSTKTHDALGRLPLFRGMRVMITENVAIGSGVVNGSEGTIHSVYFNTDSDGCKIAYAVYVHIPGCNIHLDGLDPEVVLLSPVRTSIKYDIKLKDGTVRGTFSRYQIPLVPAYVYTDFKGQGRTLPYVIIDIATAKGQGAYVMLSRVTSLAGLAVLRWFSAAKIYSRLSQELRAELDRQKMLVDITSQNM